MVPLVVYISKRVVHVEYQMQATIWKLVANITVLGKVAQFLVTRLWVGLLQGFS